MLRSMVVPVALLLTLAGCAGSRNEARVTVTENGFEPAVVTLKVGQPGTLVITRQAEATCATEAVFVENGQKYDLPLRQEVRIPIATETATTLHYACAMDMYKGQVVVK